MRPRSVRNVPLADRAADGREVGGFVVAVGHEKVSVAAVRRHLSNPRLAFLAARITIGAAAGYP
jgi:hypothetical protein